MTTLLAFLFVLGVLIFVHELGHFVMARRVGVRVLKFSLGFGPRLVGFKRGDTEYVISAVPLGGYVKMAGENPDERGAPDPRSFHAAGYPRKVAIMLAGVTMNALAAFVLFAITFSAGWDATAPVAGSVTPGMPAWEHGDLDAAPAACVVVEDAVNGIQAAKAAGMRCIAVAHTFPAERLQAADIVRDTLAEVRLSDLAS